MKWEALRAIIGPVSFVGVGFVLYFCWRFLNDGRRALKDAEAKLGAAARKAADAELLATTAASTLEVLARIEKNIVSPRVAFHQIRGTFRGLLAGDQLHANEVEAAPPDPNCRDCHGRGWEKINRDTNVRILCDCVRRAVRR